MKKALMIIVAVIFVFTLSPGAYATTQTSFKCGNVFIAPGINSVQVQAKCGTPVVKEDLGFRGKGVGRKVEKWVYGPRAGYYYVIMVEGGTVTSVEAVRAE